MPYDPRPVTEGGNRGIDIEFPRNPPKRRLSFLRRNYRVVGVDTFDGTDWHEGDYKSKKKAIEVANSKAGTMTMYYVYDDNGKCVHRAGAFRP